MKLYQEFILMLIDKIHVWNGVTTISGNSHLNWECAVKSAACMRLNLGSVKVTLVKESELSMCLE